jgi:ACDE family multidrug resistance protein
LSRAVAGSPRRVSQHGPRLDAVRPRAALLALLLASTLTVMAGAILSPVVDLMRRDLEVGETAAGLALTAHGLSLAALGPLIGRVIDRRGVRGPLAAGLALYGVTGAAGVLTTTYPTLLASRLAFGVGVAVVFVATTVALFELYAGTDRDRAMGWRSSAISIGGLAWPLLGGALGKVSWHLPFAIHLLALPLALTVLATLGPRSPEPSARSRRSNPPARDSARRALAGDRGLVGLYGVQLLAAVLLYAILVFLPLRLGELGVHDPFEIALVTGVLSACMTVVGFGYPRARRKLRYERLLQAAIAMWSAGLLIIGAIEQTLALALGAGLVGVGMGVAVPLLTTAVAERAPPELRGRATSLLATATFAGQFAAPLLLGPIAAASTTATAFAVSAGAAGAALLVLIVAGRSRAH